MAKEGGNSNGSNGTGSSTNWRSRDGVYRGGFLPVRLNGGDPYARDPSTTK